MSVYLAPLLKVGYRADILILGEARRYDEMVPDSSRVVLRGQEEVRMIDYQIQPSTRRCTVTGRDLKPGDKVYSVLLQEEGRLVRKDFSAEAWQGPPTGAFSFWVSKVIAPESKRRLPINDDLLLDFFQQLEGQSEPAKVNVRYVLALLLMRRRRLRFEETTAEAGQEILVLHCSRTGDSYRVANPGLTAGELEAVQQDVFKALGWE